MWNLDPDRPIYTQLVEQMRIMIVSGTYASGEKLPSVREMAAQASVNPNTMQRAFTELEKSGLIITQRTSGRNVTEDKSLIESVRREIAIQIVKEAVEKMEQLGYDVEQVNEMWKELQ